MQKEEGAGVGRKGGKGFLLRHLLPLLLSLLPLSLFIPLPLPHLLPRSPPPPLLPSSVSFLEEHNQPHKMDQGLPSHSPGSCPGTTVLSFQVLVLSYIP